MNANVRVATDLRAIDGGRIVDSFVGGVSTHPAISFLEETNAF